MNYGTVAQSVEQRTFNPLVASSNLARPTNIYGYVLINLYFINPFLIVSSEPKLHYLYLKRHLLGIPQTVL